MNDALKEVPRLIVPAENFRISEHGTRITPAIDKTWNPPWADDASEWYWFSREYSRCYRYHFDCAEYRIENMHRTYLSLAELLRTEIRLAYPTALSFGISRYDVMLVYWEFDAFLAAINSALDILARLVGVAYEQQPPPSFNRLCGRNLPGIAELLTRAQALWVHRMKDYRDCLVHYTPVDTMLSVGAYQARGEWHMRMKLPVNPNARDIQGFRFNRRTELMQYAAATYRHFVALDKAVAAEIRRLYEVGEYPKRMDHLFGIGARRRNTT